MNMRISLLLSTCFLALLAAPASAATDVGVAAAVNQSAEGTPPGGSVRTITLGENILHNERITTGADGLVQLLLVDGTAFTVGQNSDLTIDKFVYDPDAGTAEVAATLTKGALRFIGGRTSKTGGASINTPMGTIGVRGGVTDILAGLVNCVFGSCSLTAANGVVTNFDAGQSVVPNGSGGYNVVTTTAEMAAAGTNQVGSTGTQTGGADQAGAVATAANGGAGGTSFSDTVLTPPSTDFWYTSNSSQSVADQTIQNQNQGTPPTQNPGPAPFVPQPAGTINVRIMTSPDTYTTSWQGVIPDNQNPANNHPPAALGLVGNTGYDLNVTVSRTTTTNPALFLGTGNLTQGTTGTFTIPTYADTTFTTHVISGAPFAPFGTLSGTAFSNVDFTFYELSYLNGVTRPFYALTTGTGAPTNFPVVFAGNDIRHYSFTVDPIQGVPVPFFRAGLIDNFAGAAISDAAVILSPDISSPDSQHVRFLQTWLQISGSGLAQQSAVGVNAGDFFSDNGTDYAFRSGRRGSYRSDASDGAGLFFGALNSVAGPNGGTEVFGPNGANFVLSSDISGNDPFGDNTLDTGGANFSTVSVFNLTGSTPQSAQQSNHQLLGFSAGMIEESFVNSAGISAAPMFSGLPELLSSNAGFRINFNASSNRLGGDITVVDQFDASSNQLLHLSFGGSFDVNQPGTGVYIDDDNFGAGTQGPDIGNDTPDPADDRFTHSYAVDDSGGTLVYANGEFPVTYMVSSNAVNLGASPAFMNGTQICTCSFIEWGWWGGQPQLADAAAPDDLLLRQSIHLGTWVAGDIVNTAGYGGLSGTASYSGHVIGTVLSVDPNDSDPDHPILNQYIAGGSVSLTWNFGADSGQIRIVFDGKTFGGLMTMPVDADGALFAGDVYGNGLTGRVNGAIVSNVNHVTNTTTVLNAGIIGNFGILRSELCGDRNDRWADHRAHRDNSGTGGDVTTRTDGGQHLHTLLRSGEPNLRSGIRRASRERCGSGRNRKRRYQNGGFVLQSGGKRAGTLRRAHPASCLHRRIDIPPPRLRRGPVPRLQRK